MADDSSLYRVHFLNQYAKIPKDILDTLNSRYSKEYEGVRYCIGLVITNLLEFGEVAYSRNKNFYTKNHTKHYTFGNMMNALEIAIADGYAMRQQIGRQAFGVMRGQSSTLAAGPSLTEFSLSGEMELDVTSLPLLSVDDRPVFEFEDLDFVKTRYSEESHESQDFIDRLDRIYEESLKLNRNYWNRITIGTRNIRRKQKCFNHVGLTRIFNNGLMGRWFQKGEMSYQQLSKEERAKLRINGERVAEIDYSAMHPHILYAWEGRQCPGDFYERIMNQCGCDKFIAKTITLIAINARSYASLVGAINKNKVDTERANRNREVAEPVLYNGLKEYNLTSKEVVKAIKIAHPAIERYIYGASANKLMLVESDIMTSVLLKLMELDIPALPVHDSVIVPNQHEGAAGHIMQDTYKEHTGFNIAIK